METIDQKLLTSAQNLSKLSLYSSQWSEQLKEFYRLVDQFQEIELKSENYRVDCKAGCAHCCNHWVEDVYAFEAMVIEDYLNTHMKERLDEVVSQAKRDELLFESIYDKLGDSDEIALLNAFYSEKKACPLLDSNGLCIIYPVRPLTCRGFLSENKDTYCIENSEKNDQNGTFMILPSENVQSILDDIHLKYGENLPTSLRSWLSILR